MVSAPSAVTKRVRFEVFKRDEFTCQYCGRRTPDVVLELDHIVPRAEGGGGEIENLITACFDCNRGKGAVPLTSRVANDDLAEKAMLIAEREEQLRAYNDVLADRRLRVNTQLTELEGHWFILAEEHYGREPDKTFDRSVLRRYLEVLTYEDIAEAMSIAMEKKGDYHGVPYTIGILRNWRDHGRTP